MLYRSGEAKHHNHLYLTTSEQQERNISILYRFVAAEHHNFLYITFSEQQQINIPYFTMSGRKKTIVDEPASL